MNTMPGLRVWLVLSIGAASAACDISAVGEAERTDAGRADTASPDTNADGSLLDSWRTDASALDAMTNVDGGANSDVPMSPDLDVALDIAFNSDLAAGSDGAVALDSMVGSDAAVGAETCCANPYVRLPEAVNALENGGAVEVCVQRGANLEQSETVVVSTKQLDLGNGAGVHPAAAVEVDYLGLVETLNFASGDRELCFDITIVDNSLHEGDAEFGVGIVSTEVGSIQPGQSWSNDSAEGLPRVRILEDDTVDSGVSDAPGTDSGSPDVGSGIPDAGGSGDTAPSGNYISGVPAQWPLQLIGTIQARAYPGLLYRSHISVVGGVYPYDFTVTQGPAGLSVDLHSGVTTWQPTVGQVGSHALSVTVTDNVGSSVAMTATLEVTTEGFYFLSPSGQDTGEGGIDAPWATLTYAADSARNIPRGSVVYVREGNYTENALRITTASPAYWLAFPGETPRIDLERSTWTLQRSLPTAFVGLSLHNCGDRCVFVEVAVDLLVLDNVFSDLYATCGGCNPAFMLFSGHNNSAPRHQYVRLVGNSFDDLDNSAGSETNGAAVSFDVHESLFEGNRLSNLANYGFVDKDNTYRNTYRDNAITGCSSGIGIKGQAGAASIAVHHNVLVASKIKVCEVLHCNDVSVHHNTIAGGTIFFNAGLQNSTGLYVTRNAIRSDGFIYQVYPVTSSYTVYQHVLSDEVFVDNNIVYTAGSHVFGYSWGVTNLTWEQWRSNTADPKDVNSIFEDPQWQGSGTNLRLPTASPYRGTYGHER